MPVKIGVGPPVITIQANSTFMVSDVSGEITGESTRRCHPGYPDVTLHGVKVGSDILDLRFWHDGERSSWEVIAQIGGVQVLKHAWQPCPVDGQPDTTTGR